MSDVDLKKLKILIKRDQRATSNNGKPRYSDTVKDGVARLIGKMPALKIKKELGVSRTFITSVKNRSKTKPKSSLQKRQQAPQALQFLQMPEQINNFMKDDDPKTMPVMRLSIENGITIEIFS